MATIAAISVNYHFLDNDRFIVCALLRRRSFHIVPVNAAQVAAESLTLAQTVGNLRAMCVIGGYYLGRAFTRPIPHYNRASKY